MPKEMRPWSDAEAKKLRKLKASGHTSAEVADALGRSRASVDTFCARNGVPATYKTRTPKGRAQRDTADDLRKQRDEANLRADQLAAELKRERSRKAFKIGKARSGKRRGGFIRVTWGDSHGCRSDKAAFAAFVEDLAVLNASEVICMGDALDCDGFLSMHRAIGYTSLSEYSFADDVGAANAHWDAVIKAAPQARHDYLAGNHEDRLWSWIRDNSQNDRDREFHAARYSPQAVLSLETRGVVYHERLEKHDGCQKRGTIRRGKCLFVHGDSHAQNAAVKHLQGAGTNIVFGHTHRAESKLLSTEASGVIGAWNPGCLCERHPMYRHSAASDWSHGYGLQFIGPAGEFLHISVPILGGQSMLRPMLKQLGAA